MKYLLILLVWGLATNLAAAQAVVVPPGSLAAATTPEAPDTVAALHRLFATKRKQRGLISAGLIATVSIGALGTIGASNEIHDRGRYMLIFLTLYTVVALPVEAANLLYHRRYSKRAEERAQAAFAAHQLPPRLKRRLKAHYFR